MPPAVRTGPGWHLAAWLPVAMSLAALGLVLSQLASGGTIQRADEDTSVHVFQLLMLGQVPFIGYFALSGLARRPLATALILLLQILVAAVALGMVFVGEKFL